LANSSNLIWALCDVLKAASFATYLAT
jgi:hypothetical protein